MHKLIDYVCGELDELERKADKDGKLSMAEMQYVDLLAHTKKNLLKAEEMGEEYSNGMPYGDGSYRYPMSYAGRRNARRDSMGRYSSNGYSRAGEDMVHELREMMQNAPDDRTRQEFQRFIEKMERM